MDISDTARDKMLIHQVDVRATFLQSRIQPGDRATYVISPEGLGCTERQKKQAWRLKTWLHGLRGAPVSRVRDSIHESLLSQGFVSSTAETRVYNLNDGEAIMVLHVDDILIFGTETGDHRSLDMSTAAEGRGRGLGRGVVPRGTGYLSRC